MSNMSQARPPWKSSMTSRERFNNQMHFKPVDRSFNMEFGYWAECFEQWPLFVDNGIKDDGMADRFFGFDRIHHVGTHCWLHPAFEERVLEETPDKIIKIDAEGMIIEIPKDGHSTIPHYIGSSIRSPDDWKRCKEERLRLDDPSRIANAEWIRKVAAPDRTEPVCVGAGSMIGMIRDLLSFEGLCYAIYDYPEMVEDMVETCCQLVEHSLDQILPLGTFDFASGWEDICYKNGPIVSVDFFKEVVVPRYKRIGRRLKAHGIDVWYTDCDGDVRALLPHFLDAGINCMFPYEVLCCVHPGQLLDQYDGQLRIMGGVDKMQLIRGREATKAYLESIAPWVEKGGFIPFCDHRCPPDVNPDNYLYYLDLKERMFGMS